MKWTNCSDFFPDDWNEKIIRVRSTKELITDGAVDSAEGEYFQMYDGRQIYYPTCEWLDETTPSTLSPEIGEGEEITGDTPEQAAAYYTKYGPKTRMITEAKYRGFLTGAHWQRIKMQQEIAQLKAFLEESRNDTAVFKEWWEAAEVNIGVLTDKMIILKGAYEDLAKAKI